MVYESIRMEKESIAEAMGEVLLSGSITVGTQDSISVGMPLDNSEVIMVEGEVEVEGEKTSGANISFSEAMDEDRLIDEGQPG